MCTALEKLSSTTSESQHPDDPLPVNTHEIFSHVSTALSDAYACHVLLGDFNIHHPIWEGASTWTNRSSQLLF